MKYRGIFEYEYFTEHKPPISIDVHLNGDCVKGKIIEWEYRPLGQELRKGHWIVREDNTSFVKQIPRRWVECSYCGWSFSYDRIKDDFCSRCGADMREVEE